MIFRKKNRLGVQVPPFTLYIIEPNHEVLVGFENLSIEELEMFKPEFKRMFPGREIAVLGNYKIEIKAAA